MIIKCVQLKAIFEYCIECDCIVPFDGNMHCFRCGCDSPDGELNDPELTDEYFANAYLKTELLTTKILKQLK